MLQDEERAISKAASRRDDGRSISPARIADIPFEFVGEVAGASAVAEASDIEGGSAASRHVAVLM